MLPELLRCSRVRQLGVPNLRAISATARFSSSSASSAETSPKSESESAKFRFPWIHALPSPTSPTTATKPKEPSPEWGFLKNTLSEKLNKIQLSPEEAWLKHSNTDVKGLSPPPGPYSGRSVFLQKSNDSFAIAYSNLQQILRRNQVAYELRLSERHEKKGYKRRRLASERHRRRFAHEVRKKVQLVNEIRARESHARGA
ncbi:hypothetical protein K474DRAFT_1702680 [Panus rudis PR-1116 ss-1]|nr:hypothetical protein K474DRAFT_1702680 [Panus rudis PR-1116 ss-1]